MWDTGAANGIGLSNFLKVWCKTHARKLAIGIMWLHYLMTAYYLIKSRDITLLTKVKAMVFFPVAMYRCESWTIKKAECQRIDAFELLCWWRHLRVSWTTKEIKPVNPKRNQPWIFIGRTDADAPVFWSLDVKSWLTGKDPDAGKDWKQKDKRAVEHEMVR